MNPSQTDFDIAICGAGPVGQALALLLVKHGFAAANIVLIDAKTAADASKDARTIALSYGSWQLLASLHASPQRTTAIEQIHVSRRRHFGRTLIQSKDYAVPALGFTARYGDIVAPLAHAVDQASIACRRPIKVESLIEQPNHVRLDLSDGSHMTAGMVVQAEGGTFGDQKRVNDTFKTRQHDYQQTALIAHVSVSAPIAHRAFERFTEQGPLALLPQDAGYALVWCLRPDAAQQLVSVDDTAFLVALQDAFGGRLGKFLTVTPRAAYPLGLNAQVQSASQTASRCIAIGNAAQTLHPVAGQGLNLGLRDAVVLAKTIGAASEDNALSSFAQQRHWDRLSTISLTDSMARVFASSPDGSVAQSLLGLGLGILDLSPLSKGILAKHMLYGWR